MTGTAGQFSIRLTADFFDQGAPRYSDIGLSSLEAHPKISYDFLKEHHREMLPGQIQGAQGVIVLTPAVTRATLAGASETLAIGRFGVGYDLIDVTACTEADVAVFITAGATDRSVAEAALTWMLALSHNLLVKDRLVRTGEWDIRSRYMGSELRDCTLGVIGCGGIARKLIELTQPFGMRQPIAYTPRLDAARAAQTGVRAVTLNELMATASFVSIHCPLTAETRGMIGATELARMKPSAYLLNTARGGIVDENALFDALKAKRIAGAALDCFEGEPVIRPHRFGELDNVMLAPHAIAWTHELFRDIGRAVMAGMIELAYGQKPHGLLNPDVFDRPGFLRKLKLYQLSVLASRGYPMDIDVDRTPG